MIKIICQKCKKEYSEDTSKTRCICGGKLMVHTDSKNKDCRKNGN